MTPTPTRTPTPESTAGQDESDLPFPQTRQLLLDTAVEHFDPEREHLPGESTGFSGGYNAEGANVGSKLAWTVAGESGMGMVRVAVTSPGYTSDDYALEGFGWDIGCEINSDTCTERIVDGRRVWVAESDSETDLELGVMLERADGSLVGVGVYSQFGNNSLQPVSAMDITLEQAIAFVTDPDLHVDEAEVADAVEESASRPGRTEGATRAPDPTSTVG